MVEECTVCNNRSNDSHTVKTLDKEPTCLKCYHRAVEFFKKGTFTINEVKEAKEYVEYHLQVVTEFILVLRKYAQQEGYKTEQLLEELETMETQIAIKDFKKIPSCLTIQEHLHIVRAMTEAILNRTNTVQHVTSRGEYGDRLKATYLEKYQQLAPVMYADTKSY